ncbi:MAG: NUDIX domain-containing protein, partial [Sphingomicrobium sp.]
VARPVAEVRGELRALADRITPADRAGDFAQAMMDLGATICRPKSPRCGECPLRDDCAACASGTPEAFPAAKVRQARPHRFGAAWWTERDGSVWLVRRPATGLLGGMVALPGEDWGDAATSAPVLARVAHGFTHFTLDLAVVARAEPRGDGWWQPLETIGDAGLPTLYRRAVEAVLAQRSDLFAA